MAGHKSETRTVAAQGFAPIINRRAFLAELGAAGLLLRLPPPASSPTRQILYLAGHVSPTVVERLGPSAFNVAILAFLYVRYAGGRLRMSYNSTPVERLPPELRLNLRRLQRDFPVEKKILISLGGWGNRATFEAIRSVGVSQFLRQLDETVVEPLGLDGLDLDLEPSTAAENTAAGWHAVHDDLGATLVELTNGYMARHPRHVVTHAPIASVAAALYARDGGVRGVRGSIFEATRSASGNNIAWLNVQFYEAGDPKPVSIADFYNDQLVRPLLGQRATTGIARPWEALALGFEPRYHQSLAFCEQTLGATRAELVKIAPGAAPGGAFLWQYGQIAEAVAAWGAGLRGALRGRPSA